MDMAAVLSAHFPSRVPVRLEPSTPEVVNFDLRISDPLATMNQERWNTINQIFQAALDAEPGHRRDVVLAGANGDSSIQQEVEALLQADEQAGSYLEAPVTLPPELTAQFVAITPGEVLCGRFRIVRELGEGGMGHVFEAVDAELAVPVALKLVRPEVAINPEAIARFRQEVRLARTITHRNICRTYDLERDTRVVNGRTVEFLFLTMELLDGETLASRIKRNGALPQEEALAIARQISSALHAAHSMGITHRDMKPANIMLVPDDASPLTPRAVVTDFGLARLDPALTVAVKSAVTRTGLHIGTLAYMAPEQLEGGAVTSAADVYSFGLILFEMLAGERAFPSSNPLSGISQRLQGSHAVEDRLPANTPASWRYAIQQCLAVDPSHRPADTEAVIRIIERPQSTLAWKVRRTYRRSRKQVLAAAIFCVVALALFPLALRLYQQSKPSGVPAGTLVYLAPVSNRTGQKALENVGQLLRAGLSQSVQINLLDQGRVGDILQQMTKSPDGPIDQPTGREIAMRAGAARVIFAGIRTTGNTDNLDVDIQQLDNSPTRFRNHWTKTFSWQHNAAVSSAQIPEDLSRAIRQASDWIRNQAGESAKDIAQLDTPPEDITTKSWEALSDYSKAERLLRTGDREDAITALRESLEIDPSFAMADALLGDTEIASNHPQAGYAAYEKAISTDALKRLSLRERDRIKGLIAHDNADYEAAEAAYREYTLYYPTDATVWLRLGRPLLMLGRAAESAEALATAYKLDPTRGAAIAQWIRAELVMGNQSEANRLLYQMQARNSRDSYLDAKASAQFIEGDYEGAFLSMEEEARSKSKPFSQAGTQRIAEALAEQGRYTEAVSVATDWLRTTPNGPILMDRAQQYAMLGNDEACRNDLIASLALDDSPRAIIFASTVIGMRLAQTRKPQASILLALLSSIQDRLPQQAHGLIFDMARFRIRGEILLANRKFSEAIDQFRHADALDAPFSAREYIARALVLAAAHEANPEKAASMRREAQAYYARTALNPAMVWQFAPNYPPGFYADMAQAWIRLTADQAGSSDRTRVLSTLAKLRPAPPVPPNQPLMSNSLPLSTHRHP